MPGISRVDVDSAGDTIIGILAPTVFVEGSNIVVAGAAITPHGDSPHDAPTTTSGANQVYANGILVTRDGDLATCGHAASGSGTVFAG